MAKIELIESKWAEDNALYNLQENGCLNVGNLNTIDDKSRLDLSGITSQGNTFLVEVKKRTITKDKYGDVYCDFEKINQFSQLPEYRKLFVMNYYSDGYVGISNPLKGGKINYKREWHKTPKHSYDGFKKDKDEGYELQEMACCKRDALYKLEGDKLVRVNDNWTRKIW